MRLPLAFAVLLLASARALAEEMGASDDLSYWSDWSDGYQEKQFLYLILQSIAVASFVCANPFTTILFSFFFPIFPFLFQSGYGQISHKRHKTDSFVGLMGKRSLNSGSSERSIAQNYERRRK
ncbi:TKN1 protein, partial [Amazona guildingii]|nr:TKN1 protein [Amazona guildingii]